MIEKPKRKSIFDHAKKENIHQQCASYWTSYRTSYRTFNLELLTLNFELLTLNFEQFAFRQAFD